MASRILGPLLQRSVADYFDVDGTALDVLGAQLQLCDVALRPRQVGSVAVLGGAARLSARWSWRQLLTEPLRVEVKDLKILLRPVEADTSREAATVPAGEVKVGASERNYVERLKRRILDQLELQVSQCHICLEGIDDQHSRSVAGLVLETFRIQPAVVQNGALKQSVDITFGAYVHPSDQQIVSRQEVPHPPVDGWLVKDAAPCCWAMRSSGQRFVDWKGLELHLEADALQVSWRRDQLLCAMQLLRKLLGTTDLWEDAMEEEEFVFLDCEDAAAVPRVSWSSWLKAKWKSNSELGLEMPEDLPETERAILLEDTKAAECPEVRAKLQVSVVLPRVTLIAMDSSLEISLGGKLDLGVFELDDWTLHGDLLNFGVLDISRPATSHSVASWTGQLDTALATIKVTRSQEDSLLQLQSLTPLQLRLSPALCRCMAWLPSLVKATAAPSSSPGAWRMELEMVQVSVSIGGDPWHYGPLLLDSTGIKGSFLDGQGKLQQALTLKLDGKDLLEPVMITARTAPGRPCVRAERLCGSCDVQDLVSLVRSVKCLINYISARVALLPSSLASDVGGELSGCAAVDFECPELEMKLSDVEVGLQTDFYGTSVKASYDGQTPTAAEMGISCERCTIQVAVLDDEAVSVSICQVQGQLRLGPQLSASGSVASLKCHDPLAEAAISCGEARGAVETGEVTVVTLSCPQIQLNTTEIFLLRCKIAIDYWSDFLDALIFIEPIFLEERPFGCYVEDTKIIDSTSHAVCLGLLPGWSLCGLQPPSSALLLELQQRHVPLTLLLMPEAKVHRFTRVTVGATWLCASDISVERCGVQAKLAEADLHFDQLTLQDFHGTWGELLEKLRGNYTRKITQALPKLFGNLSVEGKTLREAAFCSASSSLAMLRFGGVATGAVCGSVAGGVATAVKASLRRGQELRRGSSDENSPEGYRFGDLTRGLVNLASERGRRVAGTYDDRNEAAAPTVATVAAGSVAGVASYAYETRMVSSTVGATICGTVMAPLGPLGVGTGMAAGSTAGRRVSECLGQASSKVSEMVSTTVAQGKESRNGGDDGYRFGDFTRGVLRAGREQREGADPSSASSAGSGGGYKPGDFTRGLWKTLRK